MKITELEREILVELADGRPERGPNVPSKIAEAIARPDKSVSRALARLDEKGLVDDKMGGPVWYLTEKGWLVVRDRR